MTDKHILLWIHDNLRPFMLEAMEQSKPGEIYTVDLLSAMTCREAHPLIRRFVPAGLKVHDMHMLMKGDFSKRENDKEARHHGYSWMQIDIDSFPEFIKSGQWKDPVKVYVMAMKVLEGKRRYLKGKFPDLPNDELLRASVAAYNCGEGNVAKILAGKVIRGGKPVTDVDHFTHEHNYSAEVFRYRDIYNSLPEANQ